MMIKLKHLKRYKQIAYLLFKYGRYDLIRNLGKETNISLKEQLKPKEFKHQELVADLEKMGPTFVKLGQLLSTQTDLLPEEYVEEMVKLQDKAQPFPYDQVRQIIQEELGVRVEDAFKEFDPEPIAAASLSQVHHAILPSGRVVAVKVQRPNIRQGILEDFDVLEELAHLIEKKNVRYGFVDAIKKLRETVVNELDFRKEALNMKTMRLNLHDFPSIMVPTPIDDYTSTRLLTMDYITGTKITKLSPIVTLELNGKALVEELFKSYNKQIFIDGIVHVDPHPGNVYLTDDGHIVLFDMGMVERIPPHMQNHLLKLFLAISEGSGEEATHIIARVGIHDAHYNYQHLLDEVSELVSYYHHLTISQMAIGRLLMKIARKAADCGIHLPPIFNMLGKALLNLDKIAKTLSPNFNPNELIQKDASDLVNERLWKNFSPSSLYRMGIESLEILQKLPYKINDVMEIVSRNELQLNVKSKDQKHFLYGVERLANRLALGMVLSALIVGAALLMRLETRFTIFGYPGFAMVLFLIAFLGGIFFALSIVFFDHREPK